MNKASIIIPHHNGERILLRCLESLFKHTDNNHEFIIVDNASSDNSIQAAKDKFNDIKIISSDINLGYAGACNMGASEAKNDYLIFLNNDTELTQNWLDPLIKSLNNKQISSVQPKIKSLKNKGFFDYAGASGGYMDIFCYPFCRGRIFNTIEKDTLQYESEKDIFWASGTAFATRKEVFLKVGMFDLKLFAHMEEIDYHWRSQMLGYKIIVNPKSIIYHEGGQTLSYQSSQKTYLNHRNSLIIFFSNHRLSLVLLLFFPRIILHLISTIFDVICLRLNHAYAQLKALSWILLNIFYIIKKRRNNNNNQIDNYKLRGLFKGSIVINYFLFNRKHYSNY